MIAEGTHAEWTKLVTGEGGGAMAYFAVRNPGQVHPTDHPQRDSMTA
jgi:hypothetical protein